MRAIVNKGIQPLWQLFLRLQFALHWAVQIDMAHVRKQSQTEWLDAFTHLLRTAGAADRPKLA
jgi:hypothetical protein